MGVDQRTIAVLKHARATGVDFSRTLTIGRQTLYGGGGHEQTADHVFTALGAERLDALDASPYEGAGLIHDLNAPAPAEWAEKYTVVFDGGSLEHIFNVAQALANCLSFVRVGGHYIAAVPANSQLGHGFYQFSPELFYRCLSPVNGSRATRVLLAEKRWRGARWYEALDPAEVGRAQLRTRRPVELFVVARREFKVELLMEAPQESDYASAWEDNKGSRGIRQALRRRLPRRVAALADSLVAWRRSTWRGRGFRRVKM